MVSMRKVAVITFKKDIISNPLKRAGFKIVKKNPDFVVSLGGDGTCLYSERKYPGVPKLFIRHCPICKNCKKHNFQKIFSKIKKGKFKLEKKMKLEVRFKGKKLIAMNDVNIHYKPPTAIRFDLKAGKKKVNNVIGDGVIISTPWGSSAYYYSITRKTFKKGIGVAFNNPTKRIKNLVIGGKVKIEVKINRGPGYLAVDNCPLLPVKKGDVVRIKKYSKTAKLIKVDKKLKVCV